MGAAVGGLLSGGRAPTGNTNPKTPTIDTMDMGNGVFGNGLGNGKALGGLFGTAGGAGGSGFAAPQSVDLERPATTAQGQEQYAQGQNAAGGQQALLAALQGQNGVGMQTAATGRTNGIATQLAGNNGVANQNSVYGQSQGLAGQLSGLNGVGNSAAAMQGQTGLNSQLAGANGVGTQQGAISGLQNVAAQQQGTANMYGQIARGEGPNPAQAMLNNATGQNVANQAALMAGQRGAAGNVGLMARQAAQQGAATQQQAAGQGAQMQAQQQVNALSGLSQQQQAMGATQQAIGGMGSNLTSQQQAGIGAQGSMSMQQIGAQQAQQNALAGQAQQQIGNQMGANQAAAGQANTMAGQEIAQTNANVGANQAQQQITNNALMGQNSSAVNMQGNVNTGNTALAQTNMQGQQAILGGTMSGVGAGMGMMGGARGGYVHLAEGGESMPPQPYAAPDGQGPVLAEQPVYPAPAPAPGPAPVTEPPPQGPQSSFGQFLAGKTSSTDYINMARWEDVQANMPQPDTAATAQIPAQPQMGYGSQLLYKGAHDSAKMGTMAAMAARGGVAQDGTVKAGSPAQKATKPGNAYSNDKVPAMLSEGEVVLPRSVMQSGNPERSAADFVAKVMARRRARAS
jgi:hypothetical protein